jgi:hypothetical protein
VTREAEKPTVMCNDVLCRFAILTGFGPLLTDLLPFLLVAHIAFDISAVGTDVVFENCLREERYRDGIALKSTVLILRVFARVDFL